MKIDLIISKHFPDLNQPFFLKALNEVASIQEIKAGDIIMDYGNYIKFVPLVFEGLIKIFREDENGNELFLYYIHPGQGCAVTFSCLDKMSSIRAQAVKDTKMITFPIKFMEEWVFKYPQWNKFVLSVYNQRFEELLNTVEEIAFHKLDERLLDYLYKVEMANETNTLQITHSSIAQELNTSREVISRLLKKLEQNGVLKLSRNQIEILG